MADVAKISIIIPVKPGGAVSALEGLRAADYPVDAWEVLVAEGCCPSRQRNAGAAQASGEVIYFLDDDSLVSPGFLDRAARHYADGAVAAVGGPSLTPATDTPLQQTFGMAFASLLGGGGMRNRYRLTGDVRPTCDRELILCNLSFRRDIFLRYGGFDERLYPNEENELMERVRRGGGVLIHDPALAMQRSQRPTLRAFCRQLFSYGRGRGEQTVISGIVKPITFVPTLFVLYLLLLPLARKPVYYLPLLCYLVMIGSISACKAVTDARPRAALLLPVVFPLFHVCYGLGLVRGIVSPRFRTGCPEKGEVTVRRVKEFGRALQQ